MKTILLMTAAAATFALGGTAIAQKAPATATAAKPVKQPLTRADVQARTTAFFNKLDTNHDGSITKQELDAVQAQQAQNIEQRAERFDPSKAFTRLDANKDGKITAAEANAVTAQGVQAKGAKAPPSNATAFKGLFARADINKDGVITKVEFDTMGQQVKARIVKAGERQETIGDQMFATADANKDGRVSLAEMQQIALARFDRTDTNHDGKITPDEVKQVRQAARLKK
jgi:Ca2+-binding EF-hand superfamily protein